MRMHQNDRRSSSAGSPPAFVFDITTLSQRANLRPTGIDRVQLEIAVELAAYDSARIAFCTYNASYERFDRVDCSTVLELGARMRGMPVQPTSRDNKRRSDKKLPPVSVEPKVLRRPAVLAPAARSHLRRAASHGWRALAEVARAVRGLGADIRLHRPKPSERGTGCFTSEWSESTTYCSVGMDWLHNDLDVIAERKSLMGFRVALMVHDLLPHVAPQFSGVDLDSYFLDVLDVADIAIVYSDATCRDLQAFAKENSRSMPEVRKLALGSALVDITPDRPASLTPEVEGDYILCVGTITIRKNHHLVFDVWERLIAEMDVEDVPTLVVVGAKGWLSDETMSRLTQTPSFAGVVHHISDATDENIAWLYQHCAFTVYPSFYEGWGLPVSESHDFGKVCLTTDRSSLPEAAEGLAELLDPYDRNLWHDRILHYSNNPDARADQEHKIRHGHVHVTAGDSANAILDTAGLPQRP